LVSFARSASQFATGSVSFTEIVFTDKLYDAPVTLARRTPINKQGMEKNFSHARCELHFEYELKDSYQELFHYSSLSFV
jgi:hypothetical protein